VPSTSTLPCDARVNTGAAGSASATPHLKNPGLDERAAVLRVLLHGKRVQPQLALLGPHLRRRRSGGCSRLAAIGSAGGHAASCSQPRRRGRGTARGATRAAAGLQLGDDARAVHQKEHALQVRAAVHAARSKQSSRLHVARRARLQPSLDGRATQVATMTWQMCVPVRPLTPRPFAFVPHGSTTAAAGGAVADVLRAVAHERGLRQNVGEVRRRSPARDLGCLQRSASARSSDLTGNRAFTQGARAAALAARARRGSQAARATAARARGTHNRWLKPPPSQRGRCAACPTTNALVKRGRRKVQCPSSCGCGHPKPLASHGCCQAAAQRLSVRFASRRIQLATRYPASLAFARNSLMSSTSHSSTVAHHSSSSSLSCSASTAMREDMERRIRWAGAGSLAPTASSSHPPPMTYVNTDE